MATLAYSFCGTAIFFSSLSPTTSHTRMVTASFFARSPEPPMARTFPSAESDAADSAVGRRRSTFATALPVSASKTVTRSKPAYTARLPSGERIAGTP